MTIETKKTIGIVGSALAALVVVIGNILMATQIKSHGAGFFVSCLAYSLAIMAGGMFITWLPNMKNKRWGFKMVEGRLKWQKDERVSDIQRTRLVWMPLITLSLELYGLFDFCNDLWQKHWTEMLMNLFTLVSLVLLATWVVRLIMQDVSAANKNDSQL